MKINKPRSRTADNSTYKKMAVQWLNKVLRFVSSSILADSFVLHNRQLFTPETVISNLRTHHTNEPTNEK